MDDHFKFPKGKDKNIMSNFGESHTVNPIFSSSSIIKLLHDPDILDMVIGKPKSTDEKILEGLKYEDIVFYGKEPTILDNSSPADTEIRETMFRMFEANDFYMIKTKLGYHMVDRRTNIALMEEYTKTPKIIEEEKAFLKRKREEIGTWEK